MNKHKEFTPPQTEVEVERLKNERSAKRMQYALLAGRTTVKWVVIGIAAGVTLNALSNRCDKDEEES